jgi:diguanylate cyclase (GGDEF)-like protein
VTNDPVPVTGDPTRQTRRRAGILRISMKAGLLVATLLGLALAAAPAQRTGEAARAEALLKSGSAHEEAGRLDDAERDYRTAVEVAGKAGDRELLATAHVMQGYAEYYRGEMNDALVNLRRGYAIAVEIGDSAGQRAAIENIAHLYADAKVGQYDRAIEYYRQLLPQYEAAGQPENVADTQFNIASTYEAKGEHATALEWYRRALATEEKLGRLEEEAFVRRSIGVTLGKLGRPAEALPELERALEVFREKDSPDRVMLVRQSRGIVLGQLRRFPAAIEDLEATRLWFQKKKNLRFLEKSEEELALAYAGTGQWREAYVARTRHAALQKELAAKLREEHTSRLRVQFDSERKEQENRALVRENAAAVRIRRLQTAVLALGAAIIAVLTYLAVRLVRDGRRMRDMAMTDELTRLPNRRHLLAAAEEQLRRSRASGEPFSLIAFDIDRFKRINDTFGHAAGDLVLQRVAHACRGALRPNDRIGRTGGEEFTAIVPGLTAAHGVPLAERLRAAVEEIDCSDIDSSLRVTISLGVAQWERDDTIGRIAARADEALYRAKDSGRNQVVQAGTEESEAQELRSLRG